MPSPVDLADDALGRLVERLTTSHHRRRLRRVGMDGAIDPGFELWASGEPPPRPGNAVRILIDGKDALAEMAEAMQTARSHVHITGWHVSPDFQLTRGENPIALRDLLAQLASRVQVRVLVWAGAPLPVLRPWRGDVRRNRDRLCSGTRIQCALDAHERPMHCHHEKTIVIDDRIAFVGGIDLTNFNGDRWDFPHHPPRESDGWHDVATRLEGPAVRDVADNFLLRWHATTGERLPPVDSPAPAGDIEVEIVRTMPDHMYAERPQGDFRILESYLAALRSARRFVYLENQFLWSPEIVAVLREKLSHPPTPDFRLVVVLPSRPNNGGDDTRGQLGTLVQADDGGGRLLACTLYAAGADRDWPVYVHAKVGVVDDAWMTIGSANLNEHSLFNDTEMNIVVRDLALIRETRLRLWAAHLGRPAEDIAGDPGGVIDRIWKPIAEEQAERRRRGQRLTHRLATLPGISRRSRLLLGPLQGLVVDA
ncbi:MAG TPA: phospholipase D family protein [Candidatus Dormibacteraeota bacterium]|nr:phospholipase D family protein [Candidatus Dormibacteraeota bacterium]